VQNLLQQLLMELLHFKVGGAGSKARGGVVDGGGVGGGDRRRAWHVYCGSMFSNIHRDQGETSI
jgi:hypothetical protein